MFFLIEIFVVFKTSLQLKITNSLVKNLPCVQGTSKMKMSLIQRIELYVYLHLIYHFGTTLTTCTVMTELLLVHKATNICQGSEKKTVVNKHTVNLKKHIMCLILLQHQATK